MAAPAVFPNGWFLSPMAAGNPRNLLGVLGLTCSRWDGMTHAQKRDALIHMPVLEELPERGNGVRNPPPRRWSPQQTTMARGTGLRPVPPQARPVAAYLPEDVETAITILSRWCLSRLDVDPIGYSDTDVEPGGAFVQTGADLRKTVGLSPRPAGQAASPYTSSASYTNGPTLLAAALAFAAGYATSRYLAPRKRR